MINQEIMNSEICIEIRGIVLRINQERKGIERKGDGGVVQELQLYTESISSIEVGIVSRR